MQRRSALPFILALVLAACGPEPRVETVVPPAAPDAHAAAEARTPPPGSTDGPTRMGALSDQWYTRSRDGQQAGWTHVVWTASEFEGRPTIHDHTEFYSASTRLMGGHQDRFVSRTLIDVERTDEGELLWMRDVSIQGGRQTTREQRFTGTGYELTERVSGLEEKRFVATQELVPVDSEAFLSKRIRSGSVGPGDTLRYRSLDYRAESLDHVVLEVEELETLSLATGPAPCLRVKETVEGKPGEATWWLDRNGVLRKHQSEGRILLCTTEERARRVSRHGVTYSITVEADPYLPRCTDLTKAVVDVRFEEREGVPLPDYPETPFSRELSRDGNTIRLELTSHDDPAATVALPVEDAALAEQLRATNLLSADAPIVKRALREAIGDETDGRKVATRLLEYVYTTLDKRSGPIPSPTAVEILRDGCGDCSEHNVLFVTLCRAAGLPARRLSGYAQVGRLWGGHAFCEVWLGKWVGADPTTNELGTRARYIAFGWSDDPRSFPGLVSARMTGRASIRTVSFEDAGGSVDVAEAARTGSEDPLSGLVLATPPKGWTAKTRWSTGHARIEGPGARCDVQVRAGSGHVPVDVLRATIMPYADGIDFGGVPATLTSWERGRRRNIAYFIPYRRRSLQVTVQVSTPATEEKVRAALIQILAPTLKP